MAALLHVYLFILFQRGFNKYIGYILGRKNSFYEIWTKLMLNASNRECDEITLKLWNLEF